MGRRRTPDSGPLESLRTKRRSKIDSLVKENFYLHLWNDRLEANLKPTDCIIEVTKVPEVRDQTHQVVYVILLEEPMYLWFSWTKYHVINEHQKIRLQRNQLQRYHQLNQDLSATGSNRIWSWDSSRLVELPKSTYYESNVIVDVFSRAVTGLMLADRESGRLGKCLVHETC
jgi:transposase InsO family protein